MERKKRYPDDSRTFLFFKCISVAMLCVMIVQTVLMATPLYVGYRFVETNKENINAFTSINGPEFVDNTTETIRNSKIVSFKILELMHKAHNLSGSLGNKTMGFEDIRQFITTAQKSLEEMSALLNPRMRGTLARIMTKSMRILEKMSDSELHDLIHVADKAIKTTITNTNVNKTMHVMDEADRIMEKMDTFLSKFTK